MIKILFFIIIISSLFLIFFLHKKETVVTKEINKDTRGKERKKKEKNLCSCCDTLDVYTASIFWIC